MRTLGQIIEACRNGERPDVDELRLAVCAMDALMTFDRRAIWTLAEAEEKRGGRAASKPQRGSKTCGCENCRRRLTGGGFSPCLLAPAPTTEPPKKP